jgi:hypothetical protein
MACPELRHTFSVLREAGHGGGVQCVLECDKFENVLWRMGRQVALEQVDGTPLHRVATE